MPVKVEVKRAANGNLLMVVELKTGSNFWKHEDESCTYVPTKAEVELIKDTLELCDTYNALKRNLRPFDRSLK